LSEKREGSSSNPSFFTLSLFLLIPFSLFFFSLSLLLLFLFFRTTAPPSVVAPPWPSARPTRSDFVFFLSSLYFVGLCKCFFNVFLFFIVFRHCLLLPHGSVGASPSPFTLGPFVGGVRSPIHNHFFLFLFLFCTSAPSPPSHCHPRGDLAPLDLAPVAPRAACHPPWCFPL